jgi:hypothetical protein
MPEANAGFFPECNRVSQLLSDFYDEFNAVIFQFQNVEWKFANKSLKALVAQFNASPYFANIEIEYPSPFPALTGTDYFEIKIYNRQLKATMPSQVLTIGVDSDDVFVYMYIIENVSVVSITASLDVPFIREERKALSGLNIVSANNSAFFEKPYFFDSADASAETSLIRGQKWINNSTYSFPTRMSTSSPMSLVAQPPIQALSREAMAVIGLMNKVLSASWNGMDYNDISDAFNAMGDNNQFPDGWTSINYGNATDQLEFTIHNDNEVIKYVGQITYGSFRFQRFIGFGTYPGINIIDVDPLTTFPIEPTGTALIYFGFYYDLDIAQLAEQCTEINESYQMPIKPGDELSFIVPMAQANVFDLTEVNVGLFTDTGVFVQKVGDANLDIVQTACTSFTFIIYPLAQYLGFPQNIGFGIGDAPTAPNTIFTPDITFDLGYGGDWPGTPEEWMDAMVAGYPAEQGSITYVQLGSGEFGDIYSVTWTLNQTIAPGKIGTWGVMIPPLMDAQTFFDTEFGQQYGEAFNCSLSVCEKFLSANVTIPAKPFGCYRFGLYNINAETEEYNLYSLSNLLRLDWSDCFSTILEFYGNENSVNQGFYYASGWRHRIRLGINGGGAKPKIEENIYRQSNGVFKRPSNKLDLTLDLHTDFLDEPTQKALVDATRHDFLIWNGENIFVEGDIDVATIQDFTTQSSFEKLAQVKFSVLVQNYQPNNNACFSC